MRIIAGKFKSRLIDFPKTKATRPMMDRMRETVFNILGAEVEMASILDLFCGSGSLGLEAISRGAKHVIFVDSETLPCDVVKKNLRSLSIHRDQATLLEQPISQALRYLAKKKLKFNLIFIDPPYNKGFIKKILRQLSRFDIVDRHGKIVIHRSKQEPLPTDLFNFQLISERPLGQAYLVFLEKKGELSV